MKEYAKCIACQQKASQNDIMVCKKNLERMLQTPQMSFFLFGPRGTGKTTWLRKNFPDAHRIDLLDEALYQSLLSDIGLFAQQLRAREPGSWVVVDEVQRIPSLLNEVHRFMEDRKLRFVLCGSSARKLKQSGTNLLAGRALRRFMHPFLPEELGTRFDLKEVLTFGSLPVIWTAPDKKGALEAYVMMYLKEEIKAEAIVRNLPAFSRFFPLAALFHGQVLNISGLSRDAGVSRTTAAGYVEILEDTLLAFRLPAYRANLRVREQKHPKLYWVDPGLVRAVQKQHGPPSPQEKGPLFEGWIASALRAYRDYQELFDDFFYWAPAGRSRVEVDFLLKRADSFVAIEVKSGVTVRKQSLGGLRAMAKMPGVVRRICVYTGPEDRVTADGVQILTVRSFFELLESGRVFDTVA